MEKWHSIKEVLAHPPAWILFALLPLVSYAKAKGWIPATFDFATFSVDLVAFIDSLITLIALFMAPGKTKTV